MYRPTFIRYKEARRIKYHYIKNRPLYGETYAICGVKISYNNVVEPQENPADDVCKQCIRKLASLGPQAVQSEKPKHSLFEVAKLYRRSR